MLMPLDIKKEASIYPSETIFLPEQHCSEYTENFLEEPRISIQKNALLTAALETKTMH